MQTADFCFVIVEEATGSSVELDIRESDDVAKRHFESVWQRLYGSLQKHHEICGRPSPGWTSWKPWDWCRETKPGYEGRVKYTAWCGDAPAGFLNVWENFPSQYQPDKGVIYLEHIAAAPGSQTTEIWHRRFRAVGAALFAYAVLISHQRGFEGRLGLHVADEEALNFYRHIHVKCKGSLFCPEKQGVAGPTPRGAHDAAKTYLETTEAGATGWLEEYRRD